MAHFWWWFSCSPRLLERPMVAAAAALRHLVDNRFAAADDGVEKRLFSAALGHSVRVVSSISHYCSHIKVSRLPLLSAN